MKKTGKALSLVLSLALVASSLTATFASAATSSETATASLNTSTVYLSNGGTKTTSGSTVTDTTSVDLVNYLAANTSTGATVKTKDGYDITTSMHLKEVVITSGSSYATLGKATKDDNGYITAQPLTLTSTNKTGTLTVAARYQGTIERGEDGTTDVTAYASTTLTLKILQNKAVYFGAKDPGVGNYPDAISSLNKGPIGQTSDGVVLTVSPADSSALAKWNATKFGTPTGATAATATQDVFYVTSTVSGSAIDVSTSNDAIALTTKTANTNSTFASGSVTLTAQRYTWDATQSKAVSGGSTATGKVVVTVKVNNTVAARTNNNTISLYGGKTWLYSSQVTSAPSISDQQAANGPQDVSNADVKLSAATTMYGGAIGHVSGSSAVAFDLEKGTVKSVGGDADSDIAFTMNGGSVSGSIGTSDHSVAANINAGTTGTIYGTDVVISSTETAKPITTGDISATTIKVSSMDSSAVKVGKLKAPTTTLEGNDVTVGQIDNNYNQGNLYLNGFVGTIAAPLNAYTVGVNADHHGLTVTVQKDASGDDPTVTVTGDAVIPALDAVDGTINFTGSLTAGKLNGITGSGVVGVQPGKLLSQGVISGVSLKLLSDFKVGDVAFKADDSAAVDSDSFTPVGYTLTKTEGTTTDTFKIATISFAGLTVSGPDTITKGSSATYTASAYPTGTSLPTGDTIAWYYTGNDDNFTFATTTDGKLTVTAKAYDSTFSSSNRATLTAKVLDSNGDVVDTYSVGTKDVAIVLTATYTSDTAAANLKVGQTYQFKITSSDGSVPPLAVASNGATVAPYTKSGNDYFFKVTAAKVGTYGVYCGGKVATLTITSDVTIDTAKVTIAAGKTYQFKVTASTTPVFQVAGVGTIKASSSNGNNYFYKVTATSTKGVHGIYVNGNVLAYVTFA